MRNLTDYRVTRAVAAGLIAGILAQPLLPACTAQAAELTQTVQFNIQPQGLDTALLQFSKQSGISVSAPSTSLSGKKSVGVSGELVVEQALKALLEGTGLTYKRMNDHTVAVGIRGEKEAWSDEGARGMRLARSETDASHGAGTEGQSSTAQGESSVTSTERPTSVEEIVVTAQKRAQRMIDVPISIVALGAEELQKRRITSLDDLALVAPGVSINSNGSYLRQIFIRGIGNSFGGSNLIGMYLDEAVATAAFTGIQLDLRTYDLERVEVLRGPQGTLYGEGAEGGIIRFITRDPQLDKFSMRADVAALFTQDGAPSQRVEGVINAPLAEDKFGLRIAGTFDHEGGWIDQPAIDKKDFNDQNLVDVRIKGLWTPTPQLKVKAMALIHRNDAPPGNGEDADGNFTQAFGLTTTPDVKDDYGLYNVAFSYDFPAVQLLSTTTYLDQDKQLINYGSMRPSGAQILPLINLLYPEVFFTGQTFAEEVRLTSNGAGPWQWTTGAYYQDARSRQVYPFYYFAIPGPPGSPLPAPFTFLANNRSKAWAVFGDASYKLTGRLTLGAGLRYFADDQEDIVNGQTGAFHALNPRVYAQYQLADQINTYVSAAKGFRSGGFNALNRPQYDPETVWTYELGTKMTVADGRLSSDAAVFYTDYRDYQVVGVVNSAGVPFVITSNAGKVRIRGVELALTWRPTEQWSFGFNGDYLDSEFVEINAAAPSFAVGDPIDKVPKYQFTVSGERHFAWNGKRGFARLDYNQQDRMTYRNRRNGPWYFSQSDVINMLNFNLSLQWSENLSLSVFGQNLLNDRGYTGANVFEGLAARARPRTYGLGFGVEF